MGGFREQEERTDEVKGTSIILVLIVATWVMSFQTLREVKRQGRETRRLTVEMQNLSCQFRRGNLHGGEVWLDKDFIVTNVVDGVRL